ncbi:hypothetical protein ACFTUC_38810 [Streptomyces sp. NPDC056944]|uniref:hypothetical protein n=1 Tax=unclassified Streptomyces TaxID=2593676 RepID=UPI00362BD7A2
MDPEITALAGTAGTTLVTLLATDTWHRVRDGLVELWQRALPDRALAIAEELNTTRDDLLDARTLGDRETEAEVTAEWQGRMRRLLTARPEVADELRALLTRLAPDEAVAPSVSQHATASGEARVYQAGRDMRVGGVEGA